MAESKQHQNDQSRPTIGIVGRKCGMTRIFDKSGRALPVTVVEVTSNRITQIRTASKDGYSAIQITTGTRHPNRVAKPQAGHYAKADTTAGRGLWEFRTAEDTGLNPGDAIGLGQFQSGLMVDVTGVSKGKGFAGTVKRWNFKTQDATHGNSLSHRAPGSIGQCQTPGRVFKGKKMAGHMGHEKVTVQNLQIVEIIPNEDSSDSSQGLLLIRGAVPGPQGSDVLVRPAGKMAKKNARLAETAATSKSN